MTKLVFFLFRDKDEETLLRADETNITIVFIGRGRKKRLLFVIFVREIE